MIEEVGAMNIFFVHKSKTLLTPKLSGSILAGITRDSILKLATSLGLQAYEESLSITEMLSGISSGSITEVFGCGTAAVIAPIGELAFRGKRYHINNHQVGPVANQIYTTLTDIQFGRRPDTFDWIEHVVV
jgi:branched-chain amino acid aminotransferase